MTTPLSSPSTPQLVASQLGCRVYDSGWRPASAPENLSVAASGQALQIELAHWHSGQTRSIPADAGEEMAAVLEGRFALQCADETHILTAGQGLLIPPGYAHQWTALEGGTLYRVTCPPGGTGTGPNP